MSKAYLVASRGSHLHPSKSSDVEIIHLLSQCRCLIVKYRQLQFSRRAYERLSEENDLNNSIKLRDRASDGTFHVLIHIMIRNSVFYSIFLRILACKKKIVRNNSFNMKLKISGIFTQKNGMGKCTYLFHSYKQIRTLHPFNCLYYIRDGHLDYLRS